jgi:hypothetical protein
LSLENNLKQVLEKIEASKKKSNQGQKVELVAATKTREISIIEECYHLGIKTIGENRIQEFEKKFSYFPGFEKIKKRFIGHLQTNKARKAVQLFDVIQTIDSLKLAQRLNIISQEEEKTQKIFLQTNICADPNKHGFSEKETILAAKEIVDMKGLKLIGIMTIPPNNISTKTCHSIYNKTRKIRDTVYKSIETSCKNLSMGMSNDYETAISEGATHIRLGTALFGSRPE